jgi:membrane carboxypeptidase/penicillin-binding protein
VAVRIGFDDNRSLGAKETGAKVALPVFREIVLGAYGKKLVGPAPQFPAEMEQRIDVYLKGDISAVSDRLSAFSFQRSAAPAWLKADR